MEKQKKVTWSIEETFHFIEIYQNEPCIWNPKHPLHKDKNRVNDSWQRIAGGTGIPVVELKKKKETLMTAFRNHLKRKKDSMRSGAGEDEIYKPIWIYFEAMEAFLSDIYECKSVVNTEENVIYAKDNEEESGRDTQYPGPQPTQEQSTHPTQEGSPSVKKSIIPIRKRRSNNPPELQDARDKMDAAFSTLNEILHNKNKDACDDECSVYGKLLGIKLKQFSPAERNELMYEIDTLIMRKRQILYNPPHVSILSFHGSASSSRSTIPSPHSNIPSPQNSVPSPHSSIPSPQNSNSMSNFCEPHGILTTACNSVYLTEQMYENI